MTAGRPADAGGVPARVAIVAGVLVVTAWVIAGWTSPAFAGVRSGLTEVAAGVWGVFRDNLPGLDGGSTSATGNLAVSGAIALALVVAALVLIAPARESTAGIVVTLLVGAGAFLLLFSPTLLDQLSAG